VREGGEKSGKEERVKEGKGEEEKGRQGDKSLARVCYYK